MEDPRKQLPSQGKAWIAHRLAWLLVGALLSVSCIIQSRTASKGAGQGGEPAPVAPRAATGNYGKVPGVDMLAGLRIDGFELQGDREKVSLSTVKVEGQPFTQAVRAETKAPSQNAWDVQLATKTREPVERGDVLLATFYFRTVRSLEESGEGQTEFVFELARDPWTKSVSFPIRASREWKLVHIPFVALMDHKVGKAQMTFRLGYAPQTIEIGGVKVENFGKQLALADLPTTKITYPGMEPDAAWREAAAQRIETRRKADLRITVLDNVGKPVSNAAVKVQQLTHEFAFGTCVAAGRLVGSGNERYRQVVTELFNSATLENNLKWVALAGDWGGSFKIEQAQAAVDWLRQRGLAVRGHVLVWPGWKNLPRSLRQHEKDPARLRREVEQHIREVATAMRGRLDHWDVVNEPFDNHDLLDILGTPIMADWFRLARSIDAKPKLFINDYAILSGGGGGTPHRDYYEKTIRQLLDAGAPVDGIGLQGHFGTSLTAPEDLLRILDRFAEFKKPIIVTEYDVVVDDEELAAQYTRDFYTLLFSHPAVTGVTMWGFWDGAHWKHNAPIYRQDWSLKPAGQAYQELVQKTWHTEGSMQTDAEGRASLRGFRGDYSISVQSGGKKKVKKVSLGAQGVTTNIMLD